MAIIAVVAASDAKVLQEVSETEAAELVPELADLAVRPLGTMRVLVTTLALPLEELSGTEAAQGSLLALEQSLLHLSAMMLAEEPMLALALEVASAVTLVLV